MVVSSPEEFAAAVERHPLGDVAPDDETIARARASVADAGVLVVGEPHGVRETPGVVYALASVVGARAIAFEWSHEEMDEPVQEFLRRGSFDFERLWSLPASAEFFCGDGRIAAGHFALLRRLRDEGRLDQVVVFDRLDREPPQDDWRLRDRELADRLLAEWDERLPLLVLTGAFHAQLDGAGGKTMAMCLAEDRPGLEPVMLVYAKGHCWSRGGLHDVSGLMPDRPPFAFRLAEASPAVVPGPRLASSRR